MPEFSKSIIRVARASIWRREAQEQVSDLSSAARFSGLEELIYRQGGLLSGQDPSDFNEADPLRLWIIQVGE